MSKSWSLVASVVIVQVINEIWLSLAKNQRTTGVWLRVSCLYLGLKKKNLIQFNLVSWNNLISLSILALQAQDYTQTHI